MPLNGLTSGIDCKITYTDRSGVLHFEILESFTSKEDATVDQEVGMDGTTRHPKFHRGWSGSFVLQRSTSFMDAYIADQEAAYYLGVDQLPVTITQTITEVDGSVTQFQYTNAVLTLDDAGMYSGTAIVKQNVSYSASRRLKLI